MSMTSIKRHRGVQIPGRSFSKQGRTTPLPGFILLTQLPRQHAAAFCNRLRVPGPIRHFGGSHPRLSCNMLHKTVKRLETKVMDVKCDLKNTARRLETRLESLRNDRTIIPANKKLILEFDSYIASIGLGRLRRLKYLGNLSWFSREFGKPFSKVTKKDLLELVGKVETSDLKAWTKADRKILIKRFFKWFKGNDEDYPDEVRWIKCHVKERLVKLPEELISEDEIKRMADAATKPRDKAMIQVLYESGCRIMELLTIQLKNVEFDDFGAIIRVTGKTGDRRIRLVASSPALALWMDFHPYKDDPEAYLWSRYLDRKAMDKLPLHYSVTKKLICSIATKAGVRKKITPHLFRHSRATALANKLTEAQMKEYFGWVQGSDMASVYVHLSGRDVDNAILDVYGLRKKGTTEAEKFHPINCKRCATENSPGSKFCTSCGLSLITEPRPSEVQPQKPNDLMRKLMQDGEFKEIMMRKIVEMNL